MSRAPLLSLTALRVIAVTALSFSFLAACAKAGEGAQDAAAEAAIEAGTGMDVDVEDGGQTLSGTDRDGQPFAVTQGDAATLPPDFPDDLLVPEGLVLETSMVFGGSMMVGGVVPGDRTALAGLYSAHMEKRGWTSLMSTNADGMSMQAWQQGRRNVSVMIESKDEGQLGVTISHAEEPQGADEGTAPSA